MGDFLDTLKSVYEAGKAVVKSASSITEKGAKKLEEAVADLPLPDEIPNAPAELLKNPVDKFRFYQKYYERLGMLWSAKYSQAESTLSRLKMQKGSLKDQRINALEDIEQIEDDLKIAKERRDRFSSPDPMYVKYSQEIATLEAQLAAYNEKRSGAQDAGKSTVRSIKDAERQRDEAKIKSDYFQEQYRRSTHHFNKAVEEAAKKK